MSGGAPAAIWLAGFGILFVTSVAWAAWPFLAELMGVPEAPDESEEAGRPSEGPDVWEDYSIFYRIYP